MPQLRSGHIPNQARPSRPASRPAWLCFFLFIACLATLTAGVHAVPPDDPLLADAVASDDSPRASAPDADREPATEPPADPDEIISLEQAHQLLPYSYTAYILPQDATEVDLGLILSSSPGIQVAVGWGAVTDWMVNARLTVEGASSVIGIGLHYQLRPETAAETKPAIAILGGARFVNQRTGSETRDTVFRGNRFQTGLIFTKSLGSLAAGLEAEPALRSFLNYFIVHAQALAEYQAGREHAAEDAVNRVEFGMRAAMEAEIEKDKLFFSIAYDSLPDWMGRDNYFLGMRYFSHPDFAIDGQVGRIGDDTGLSVALAWIF